MTRTLTEIEVVMLVCSSIASTSTVARLFLRRRRFWVDDAWALFALLVLIVQFVALFIHPQHPREGVVRYYLMATTFYTIVWSARLSLLFSLIRVDPHAKRRKSLFFVASVYIGLYILLTGQLFWICAPQQTWKTAVVPQCPIGFPVAVLQLITDLLADGTLLIVPMFLFSIISDGSLRYRLMVIFSTCIITTVVSLVHTIYVLTTGGIKVEIAALVEDCVSLVVCNIPVISSALLRSREDKSRQPGTNLLSSIAFRSDGQDSDSLYVDIY
ncbi:hypothetical protein AX15_003066 [Amanita polypyramis BW_CC]|nr:hypothetical protein AX15_003066 [Amanita polypyramis BW_CC]